MSKVQPDIMLRLQEAGLIDLTAPRIIVKLIEEQRKDLLKAGFLYVTTKSGYYFLTFDGSSHILNTNGMTCWEVNMDYYD